MNTKIYNLLFVSFIDLYTLIFTQFHFHFFLFSSKMFQKNENEGKRFLEIVFVTMLIIVYQCSSVAINVAAVLKCVTCLFFLQLIQAAKACCSMIGPLIYISHESLFVSSNKIEHGDSKYMCLFPMVLILGMLYILISRVYSILTSFLHRNKHWEKRIK